MHHLESKKKAKECSKCNGKAYRIPQKEIETYLSPGKRKETEMGSVKYKGYRCTKCGNLELEANLNKSKRFSECPSCHNRTVLVSSTVLLTPECNAEGEVELSGVCQFCGHEQPVQRKRIPRKNCDDYTETDTNRSHFGNNNATAATTATALATHETAQPEEVAASDFVEEKLLAQGESESNDYYFSDVDFSDNWETDPSDFDSGDSDGDGGGDGGD